jgi:hypothetical protein
MSEELAYESLQGRSLRSWMLIAVCSIAVLLMALCLLVPAALRYYVSSADCPVKETNVVADQSPASATTASETAAQNFRLISIDRPAPPSAMTEGPDSATTGEIAVAAPEVARPPVEEAAQTPQAPVQAAKVSPPLQPVGQALASDDAVALVLRPPFPRPRPRVNAMIAAAAVPIPQPRPEIPSDETTREPDVITDRSRMLN